LERHKNKLLLKLSVQKTVSGPYRPKEGTIFESLPPPNQPSSKKGYTLQEKRDRGRIRSALEAESNDKGLFAPVILLNLRSEE